MALQQLVIMAKAPVMGSVKTRLARDIGTVKACQFYRRTLQSIIHRTGFDKRWQTHLAITPINTLNAPFWPAGISQILQQNGNLGDRMQNIFDHLHIGPVIIIGTDIPGLSNVHIAAAFKALRKYKVIIGPSVDGGYWLIGQQRTPKSLRLFDDVRWSSKHALLDTIKNIKNSSHRLINTLHDVDEGESYNELYSFSTRIINSTKIM